MYPISISNGPVFGGEYVPYFYQSGRFLAYSLTAENVPSGGSSTASGAYNFTSDLNLPRKYLRGQTVEQIISHGYLAIPKSDPETALISDKRHTSWLGLDDLIGQVQQRRKLYQKNIYELELAKCYALNAQFSMVADRGNVPADSREIYSLNKRLQELYQQQRDERVRLWQDVSKLRQAVPESAQQYLASYRKLAILRDEGDGT